MRTVLKGSALFLAILLPAPAMADVVSICFFQQENANNTRTDVFRQLVVLGAGSTPYDAEQRAKKTTSASDYVDVNCYTSGDAEMNGGWYAIHKSGRTKDSAGKPVERYVAGFGPSRDEAVQKATERLKSLPGPTREHLDNKQVVDAKEFGDQ